MMASILLAIDGMSCAGCVQSVQCALQDAPGVEDVSVNFADESAAVSGEVEPAALLDAVRRAGYSARQVDQEDPAAETERLKQRLRSKLLKSGLLLAFGALLMGDMHLVYLPPLPDAISLNHSVTNSSATTFWLGMTAVALLLMWYAGGYFYKAALMSARYGRVTMDTLITLGTGAAILYSLLVLLLPELLPASARHLYLEAAVFILGFVSLGKALEMHARGRASLAVKQLLTLTPDMVIRLSSDPAGKQETSVPLAEVKPGDRLRILPGQRLPVDGTITEGETSIDESLLTGEPLPVNRQVGDSLYAGTTNQLGSVVIEAAQVGKDTQLHKVAELVKHAQNTKPEIGILVDRVAAVFVPLVLLVALVAGLCWWLLGPEPRLPYILVTTISVLVIACPCALGLAVPMSIMVGMRKAVEQGLLIRNGDVLQQATRLTLLVVDKTGTLTEGQPQVIGVKAINGKVVDDETDGQSEISAAEKTLLTTIASLETMSEHPLAKPIVEHARARGCEPLEVSGYQAVPGGGLLGEIAGERVAVGKAAFLAEQGFETDVSLDQDATVHVGRGNQVLGSLELADEPRATSARAVTRLQKMGIRVLMLTGDTAASARRVAAAMGGMPWQAGMTPEGKLQQIRKEQAEGEVVGMVGDGINDAPALSAADVGFAMGSGADIAIESADVALPGNNLELVANAVVLSRRVLRNIRQNLVGAFAYNIVLIPVAAGALYPHLGLLVDPITAGMAMAVSSITVVINAGRLALN